MSDAADREKYRDLWRKLHKHKLDFHALEELASLLNEAKIEEQRKLAEQQSLADDSQRNQIDALFRHVIVRLKEVYQKETKDLAKHLVAIDKLEKGFASFLVARIEAMDHRMHYLHVERARLERLIDSSSKSVLGTIFTGLKSQYRLQNVKAELRSLQEEKQRVWQKKEAFNLTRSRHAVQSKEEALTLLQRQREERLWHLQDRLLDLMDKQLSEMEAGRLASGFFLHESSYPCFGRFKSGLSPQEKSFIDQTCHPNTYVRKLEEVSSEMEQLLKTSVHELSELPNRCLFFAKLLAGKRAEPMLRSEILILLYDLFERQSATVDEVRAIITGLPEQTRQRITKVVALMRRIAYVNGASYGENLHHPKQHYLAGIFRDLLARYHDVLQALPESRKPSNMERRRHHERVNRTLDEMLHFIVHHWEALQSQK